ncbi:MAG: CpaF family protein [Sneathiella sp.]
MFGKKLLNTVVGFQEEPDEWEGPEKPNPLKFEATEKVDVSPEDAEAVRKHFFKLVNPSIAANMSKEDLIVKITSAVMEIVDSEKIPLNWKEQGVIAQGLLNDMMGIGPIEVLLLDEDVTDILVNGYDCVYIERFGALEKTGLKFRDDQHVNGVARRIAASVGRRIDESNPMVDARLLDGSRVNIITPPLSVHGTIISIRKFPKNQISLEGLVGKGCLSIQMAAFLEIATGAHLNILISGGTGTGKTTLLNAMSANIGDTERVVTIEDAVEIDLLKPHVVSLETRQRNIEGKGEVSQRDLLRNALRMRPDRIIIGEVRGAEAHEMLEAMNTGHDGSMSTVHANSARDALLRVENLLLTYRQNFHAMAVRRQISSALDLVVHVTKDFTGHRHIESITEVVGVEGDTIVTQELFSVKERDSGDGVDFSGKFVHRKIRPHCETKVKRYGLEASLQEVMDW